MKYSYKCNPTLLEFETGKVCKNEGKDLRDLFPVQTGLLHTHKHFISLFTTVVLQQCM